jgi:galactonate dehydratase
MARTPVIRAIRTSIVHVTARTNWVFVIVDTDDDRTGVGEATLDGHETHVLAEIAAAARVLVGTPAVPSSRALRPHPAAFGGMAHNAAISAIEQALWDLLGQRLGAPVSELLGGPSEGSVRLYANVNRAILGSRAPEAFAGAAVAAVDAGFDAVKVAPFDGLRWEPEQDRAARRLIDAGLARIHAVRDAVGPEIDVLIDCHGRFNPRAATVVVREMEKIDPYWIEAPVSERDLEGWRRVRDSTSARLAGGEFLVGLEAHRRFIEATGVDVVMPDVKYCGGIGGLAQVTALAAAFGTEVAPHNPSGPVSTAATAHAALAAATPQIVEFACGEASWRSELVGGGEVIEGGRIVLDGQSGLGVHLDEAFAAGHPFEETPVSADLWER